jgi:hypothetical protein
MKVNFVIKSFDWRKLIQIYSQSQVTIGNYNCQIFSVNINASIYSGIITFFYLGHFLSYTRKTIGRGSRIVDKKNRTFRYEKIYFTYRNIISRFWPAQSNVSSFRILFEIKFWNFLVMLFASPVSSEAWLFLNLKKTCSRLNLSFKHFVLSKY